MSFKLIPGRGKNKKKIFWDTSVVLYHDNKDLKNREISLSSLAASLNKFWNRHKLIIECRGFQSFFFYVKSLFYVVFLDSAAYVQWLN